MFTSNLVHVRPWRLSCRVVTDGGARAAARAPNYPPTMSIDTEKNRDFILQAFNDVVSDKKATNW